MNIIRVFPRRTSMTPVDDMAFVGKPRFWMPNADEVHVSVTFTWDIPEGQYLQQAWAQYYPVVKIGGPAFGDRGNGFTPGMYVREGLTFTSRGCNRRCPWCFVPEREGRICCLEITPGNEILDNNFLQTGYEHMDAVFTMLDGQSRAATFSGGLDARLVDDWVADRLSRLRISELFLAADTAGALRPLRRAVDRLGFLGKPKLRCFVLVAFDGETIPQATERLEAVYAMGAIPFAMLWQPKDRFIDYSSEWKALQHTWTRPAAMAAMHVDIHGSGE